MSNECTGILAKIENVLNCPVRCVFTFLKILTEFSATQVRGTYININEVLRLSGSLVKIESLHSTHQLDLFWVKLSFPNTSWLFIKTLILDVSPPKLVNGFPTTYADMNFSNWKRYGNNSIKCSTFLRKSLLAPFLIVLFKWNKTKELWSDKSKGENCISHSVVILTR